MKIYFERLGPKLPRYYMQIMLIVILLFSMTISAAAAEDMWEAADRIIKDVYTKIAGISTVLAGLMSPLSEPKCPITSIKPTRHGIGSNGSGFAGSS